MQYTLYIDKVKTNYRYWEMLLKLQTVNMFNLRLNMVNTERLIATELNY